MKKNARKPKAPAKRTPVQASPKTPPPRNLTPELCDHLRRDMLKACLGKATTAALAARAHWLTVEWLPKYAPELNDIEGVWRDPKSHYLAHQTFADVDALDNAIEIAVTDLNNERQ